MSCFRLICPTLLRVLAVDRDCARLQGVSLGGFWDAWEVPTSREAKSAFEGSWYQLAIEATGMAVDGRALAGMLSLARYVGKTSVGPRLPERVFSLRSPLSSEAHSNLDLTSGL